MIFIIFGTPRAGKTYMVVDIALRQMKQNKKVSEKKRLKVFSNFPIYDPKLGYTLEWKPEYASEVVTDSIIIIDEAYRNYSSRNSTKGSFTVDEHTMFATNGHNNNDFYLIVHDPARLDTVIREMCNCFYYVRKYTIPLISRPIGFRVESYLDQQALAARYTSPYAMYGLERYFFKMRVARAYDTHFFRKDDNKAIAFRSWSDVLGSSINPLAVDDNGSCFNSFVIPKKNGHKKFFYIFEFFMFILLAAVLLSMR